jgi:hypothetical protein
VHVQRAAVVSVDKDLLCVFLLWMQLFHTVFPKRKSDLFMTSCSENSSVLSTLLPTSLHPSGLCVWVDFLLSYSERDKKTFYTLLENMYYKINGISPTRLYKISASPANGFCGNYLAVVSGLVRPYTDKNVNE